MNATRWFLEALFPKGIISRGGKHFLYLEQVFQK